MCRYVRWTKLAASAPWVEDDWVSLEVPKSYQVLRMISFILLFGAADGARLNDAEVLELHLPSH